MHFVSTKILMCSLQQHELVCKWVLKACQYCKEEVKVMKVYKRTIITLSYSG